MDAGIPKTKLVCTIGPASEKPEMMLQMINAGMNIARLNYAHGNFAGHAKNINELRNAARTAGKRLAIMADLPGPKIRIGKLATETVELGAGDSFILTTDEITGNKAKVSVGLANLTQVVKPGDIIFMNDGMIQVKVELISGADIHCKVIVGGELRSFKGVNLPGLDLGISAFTKHDYECLKSALENGVDAISQSFVDEAKDVLAVRKAAQKLGYNPFIVAKIERAGALERIDDILKAADCIMIGRGDLGVEINIERIAVVQKELIAKANLLGKPVITATQMLESMVENPRPTRAEATDAANAILDGTDCIMLSEESAMGKYPLEAVRMLVKIANATEPHRHRCSGTFDFYKPDVLHLMDIISHNVQHMIEHLNPVFLIAHTVTGHTARMISRFRLPVWITAVCNEENICRQLQFSYGVESIHMPQTPQNWKDFIKATLSKDKLPDGLALLVEGPSPENPTASHKLEIIDTTK
ncbi:MAG: pyruvate kinase [Candidatus Cloacimonadaceae bacterium]